MMAALPLRPEDLGPKHLARALAHGQTRSRKPLPLGIPALDRALPDQGLPTGAVVELCAPMGLGRVTHLALAACAAAQRSPLHSPLHSPLSRPWAAWIDPEAPGRCTAGTLFAPALVQAGVDLQRLLVVRPQPPDIARVAVRLATSRLFRLIVLDRSGIPGAAPAAEARSSRRWSTVVRRLALAAESSDTSVLLLSSTAHAHRDLLPTAMRIELSLSRRDLLELHVTKDRRGRLSPPVAIPMPELAKGTKAA